MKLTIKQGSNLFFATVLTLVLLIIFVFKFSQDDARKNEYWVTHTHEVINASNLLINALKDAETGQRGYLLSQDESYLTPYFNGVEMALKQIKYLTDKVSDNPIQQNRIFHIDKLVEAKFIELEQTIDLQIQGDRKQALDIVKTNLGFEIMNQIRVAINEFIETEQELLATRKKHYLKGVWQSQAVIISLLVVVIIFLIVIAFLVRANIIKPINILIENTKAINVENEVKLKKLHVNNELGDLTKAFINMNKRMFGAIEEFKFAKIESDRASEAKSSFLANMSHEVRTPINGIYGSLQMLKQNSYSKQQDYVDLVESSLISCQALLVIINDILDFSKIEAGHLDLETIPFNFEHLLQLVISDLSPVASGKNIEITQIKSDNYEEGWLGDPTRVKQILLNLVSNAVKFTDNGEVKIHYSTITHNQLSHLNFVIKDTGIGMTTKTLESLFDRFEQADKSTTRRYGGTGLGMSITNALVHLMKGNISVSSEIGKGSCFDVTIPLAQTELDNITVKKELIPPPDLHCVSILLAEDNKINQTIFLAMIKTTFADVKVAENGKEAVDLVDSYNPDLIFMDIQMPIMDGLEANQKIKARYPAKPVVALTANVMESDIKTYQQQGFVYCLPKPLEMQALYDCLNTVLYLK